jgi:hypothetical protein
MTDFETRPQSFTLWPYCTARVGAHRDLQLHCHQAHLFTAPARTVTPRGLRVKPGWPKQTTCFSRGAAPAETRANSSCSPAAAETVHRVTATLLGRHRRRPGLQRLEPDAALFGNSPHLAGQDRPTKSGEPNPRRGLPGRPGGARQLLRGHVMLPRCASPRCRERSMLGVGPASPLTGSGSRGGPRGVWSPRVRPAPSQRGLAIADR